MELKLKEDFENKLRDLMKELNINGNWYLDEDSRTVWEIGNPFPKKIVTHKLFISVLVPDDMLEVVK